ncbi:MAG: hypothetical protein ACQRW7_05680 [Caulobacterales bacterium]|uniref:hypothetical protein n=1 Tax=Glycocaulis sp. TaxID=1969725 RepID=UPI003FA07E5E
MRPNLTPRLLALVAASSLLMLPGCLAAAATGAIVGTTVGVAGNVAEGAVDVVTTSDEEEERNRRRRERD